MKKIKNKKRKKGIERKGGKIKTEKKNEIKKENKKENKKVQEDERRIVNRVVNKKDLWIIKRHDNNVE